MLYENEIKRIISASQNNSLTFFVGAGVSKLSGAPSWDEMIKDFCIQLNTEIKEKNAVDECMRYAQMYYNMLNQRSEDFYAAIRKYLDIELSHNEIHKEMFSLNPHSVITTNYDELIETAAYHYCRNYKTIASDVQVPSINGNRYILKVHGDLKNENIVLKEEDYLNYSENFRLIETLMKSLFSMNTVVFLGYRLNDYNIKKILRWAKNLLGEDFKKPIFVYTGKNKIKKEELEYEESKGVEVIDTHQFAPKGSDYLQRYIALFQEIFKQSSLHYYKKNKKEAFDITFNRMKPLDELSVLQIKDVNNQLYPDVLITDGGTIISYEASRALEYYFQISMMESASYNSIPESDKTKYELISRVFNKAGINSYLKENGEITRFQFEAIPKDLWSIHFDYTSMDAFTKIEYQDLKIQYKKAYYFAKLYKYEEAYFLFADVAFQAFQENDYTLYYLAELNHIVLYKIIKKLKSHAALRLKQDDQFERRAPFFEMDQLFGSLPYDYRNRHVFLKKISLNEFLFQYIFWGHEDKNNLNKTLDAYTVEYGRTSADKVIDRINHPLFFLVGNYLLIDEFDEYKNTTRELQSGLIQKYTMQDKITLRDQSFALQDNEKIVFDELDFYVFLTCFKYKDLKTIFKKYEVNQLDFINQHAIEESVRNLLNYYAYICSNTGNHIEEELSYFQQLIRKSVFVLRYVDISQSLVDHVSEFILQYEFRDMLIDEKIIFFENQIRKRNKYSDITRHVIENKLICSIDHHIMACQKKESFQIRSGSSQINYYDLAIFLSLQSEAYHSRRLSNRVAKIIAGDIRALYGHIAYYYWPYISKKQQKDFIIRIKELIRKEFQFDLAKILISCCKTLDLDIVNSMKKYLRTMILEQKGDNTKETFIKVSPPKNPYADLELVGYWYRNGYLPDSFSEFVGISDWFDLFYQGMEFDFKRFNVSWLLDFSQGVLESLSENRNIKMQIREVIAETLSTKHLLPKEKSELVDIAIKYFY